MSPNICPSCGNEIDAAEAQGLCPACLVRQGVRPETEEDPLRKALEAKLQAQYRLIRRLGLGGMGAVYLARDLTLDREVAIKVVKPASDDATMYERLRREAKTAARLSHPNIVPLHAFGEVEGMPYFVMGYVRGESLADRLKRERRLPEEEARRILGEIADALDHAHRQGVVHRDVKPDNVLLDDETGRALLTDFGVAKGGGIGETLTEHGSVIGTPQYMSPEQASGRTDIDGRSDIYSLGVMAWSMVTGRLPFEGATPADMLRKHLIEEPPALRSVAPYVSDGAAQAIERCLAKEPDGRWGDARSLRMALAVDEESQLPDALRPAESSGIPALGITWALALFYAALMRGLALERGYVDGNWDVAFINVCIPAIAVFFYLFFVMRLGRQGFSAGESQRVIWREPTWWLWWYPRALRRRGNVWERLPAAVRYLRWSIVAFVANMFALWTIASYFGMEYASRSDTGDYGMNARVQFGIFVAIVITWGVFTMVARRELRRKGLFEDDVNRVMMSVPPSRIGFWARPHIAAILAPAAPTERSRLPESPHAQMQSIIRHADELSGPLRPLGAQAVVAARQLVGSIEQTDRQIADLVRNLEPGEEERLANKIEALAGVDDYAPMRSLLEQQLELIREMSSRIDEAKERRQRHVEMLRTLALHMASLWTRASQTTSEVRVVSDEVRGLCDEIGRQAEWLEDGGRAAIDDVSTINRAAKSTP